MTLTHLTPADYVTTQWSGGATTPIVSFCYLILINGAK